MKHLIYFRDILIRVIGQIIIALVLFSTTVIPQESISQEFPIASSIGKENRTNLIVHDTYEESGMNTIKQYANSLTQDLLRNYNLHTVNMDGDFDLIYHYSSSYYSKWEAEEDQQDEKKVGVKHSDGKIAIWIDGNDTVSCWSTKEIIGPRERLVYGPHYHQEKWYRRWLYMSPSEMYDLKYFPRYKMALEIKGEVDSLSDVCKIYVVVTNSRVENGIDSEDEEHTLMEPKTFKVKDFPNNGEFEYFYFSDLFDDQYYIYPEEFREPECIKGPMLPFPGVYYDDKQGGQGIQFCVDWLRSDTLCTLYIDNIEVYDGYGWNNYIDNPIQTANFIKSYADSFKTLGWTNIKYWVGGHEPSSIDSYTPIRIVDSLIQSDPVNAPPLMNIIWPHWTLELNGEIQLERYYNMVQPDKLIFDFYPVLADYDVIRPFDFEVLRRIFQVCYSVTQDNGFYYDAQSFGFRKDYDWDIWRFPYPSELNATVMLGLAHGMDGLTLAHYDSFFDGTDSVYALIGFQPNYEPTSLWYLVRDNFVPRLKGKLGKTLLDLDYTGDLLGLRRHLQVVAGWDPTNTGPTMTNRYLTLTEYTGETPPPPVHFHAGFFSRPQHPLDDYFMLDNLITTMNRTVTVTIDPPYINDYENYRFRNIEGVFDTTIHLDPLTMQLEYTPGEGYLYEVAPVVLYGGRLLYSEDVGGGMELNDDMIIENGATLTIYDTYTANANIIVKNGSIINGNNGKIHFAATKKLIVDGQCSIYGTSGNKLNIEFDEFTGENQSGIEIALRHK